MSDLIKAPILIVLEYELAKALKIQVVVLFRSFCIDLPLMDFPSFAMILLADTQTMNIPFYRTLGTL